MNTLSKNLSLFALILTITFISFSNSFALDYYQKTTINSNKTGTISIRYSASTSELNGADVYYNLPFKEDKIRAAFSSGNNIIKSIGVNTKVKDKIAVIVEINFTYIGKIVTAPYFSKVKVTYYESADSTVFMYQLPKEDNPPANFNPVYTFDLPAKEILKTSGTIKGNSVVYGLKPDFLKRGVTLFVKFNQTEKTSAAEDNKTNDKKSDKGEKEEGSCGLFGIELPLIIGLGYAFNRKFKKRK